MTTTDEALNAHYAVWRSDPNTDNQQRLFEQLYFFIQGKGETVYRDDGLAKHDKVEDVVQNLYVELSEKLTVGKDTKNVAHYANRAWTLTKWRGNEVIGKAGRKFSPLTNSIEDENGKAHEVNEFDPLIVREFKLPPRSIIETEAEYQKRYKRMMKALPPELQDVCGLWMQMKTEAEISEVLGISTQKVGRLKAKIKETTAAMPDNRNRSAKATQPYGRRHR